MCIPILQLTLHVTGRLGCTHSYIGHLARLLYQLASLPLIRLASVLLADNVRQWGYCKHVNTRCLIVLRLNKEGRWGRGREEEERREERDGDKSYQVCCPHHTEEGHLGLWLLAPLLLPVLQETLPARLLCIHIHVYTHSSTHINMLA